MCDPVDISSSSSVLTSSSRHQRYNETQGILTAPLLPTSTTTQQHQIIRKRSGASSSLALASDNAEKLLLRPGVDGSSSAAPNANNTNNVMTSNGNSNAAATTGQIHPDTERTYYWKKKTIEDFVLPVKTAASHVCVYNHTSWSNRRCCLQNGLCGLLFKADWNNNNDTTRKQIRTAAINYTKWCSYK